MVSNSRDVKLLMLIEDSQLDTFLYRFVIKDCSSQLETMEYSRGDDAIAYLKKIGEDDEALIPDIILLDMNMPIMDGFEFLDEYAKLPATILNKCNIYILSSTVDPEEINRSISNEHVKGYFEKPLTYDAVRQILSEV